MADLDPPDRFPTKVYAGSDRTNLVGQLETTFRVSHTNLYSMVAIVCIFSQPFHIEDGRGGVVGIDEEELKPGDFFIITRGRLLFFLVMGTIMLEQKI